MRVSARLLEVMWEYGDYFPITIYIQCMFPVVWSDHFYHFLQDIRISLHMSTLNI